MLALDLTSLSGEELDQIVAEYCSSFGDVKVLKVSRPSNDMECGAAAVRMSTVDEADELARNIGGLRCGSKVIIRITQQGWSIPIITRANFFRGSGGSITSRSKPFRA
jgi:hypothetical protein